MSTLVDLVFEENPGRRRQELLKRIEGEVRKQSIWGFYMFFYLDLSTLFFLLVS
jgi:hypothetical protein